MPPKLPDSVRACNELKSIHQYNKKYRRTHKISVVLFDEQDSSVASCLITRTNLNTKNISFAHALRWKGNMIYPQKFKKRSCINQHTLEQLYKTREYQKNHRFEKYTQKIKKNIKKRNNDITFNETIEKHVFLEEHIRYNPGRGTAHFDSRFKGNNGVKLYIILDKEMKLNEI